MHDLYFYSTDLIFFLLWLDLAWSYMHRVILLDEVILFETAMRLYKIHIFMQCAPDPYEFFQSIFSLRALSKCVLSTVCEYSCTHLDMRRCGNTAVDNNRIE